MVSKQEYELRQHIVTTAFEADPHAVQDARTRAVMHARELLGEASEALEKAAAVLGPVSSTLLEQREVECLDFLSGRLAFVYVAIDDEVMRRLGELYGVDMPKDG